MKQLKQKYYTQKSGAKARNIEWQFTFEAWVEWWGNDIANRGNRSGQLVMARKGDTGPYHPDNVYKITANANHSEAHANGLGWTPGSKHRADSLIKISLAAKKPRRKGITRIAWTEERKAKVAATWAQKKGII